MANELVVSITDNYQKNGLSAADVVTNQGITVTSNQAPQGTMSYSVPTAGENIPLGAVSAPRVLFIQNVDPTNYIQVKTASGGTLISELKPGDPLWLPLDP